MNQKLTADMNTAFPELSDMKGNMSTALPKTFGLANLHL